MNTYIAHLLCRGLNLKLHSLKNSNFAYSRRYLLLIFELGLAAVRLKIFARKWVVFFTSMLDLMLLNTIIFGPC